MSVFDLIVFIIIGIFAVIGFKNGIIREVFRLFGLILAIFVAFTYFELFKDWITSTTGILPSYALIISFLVLFFSVILLIHIAIWLIEYVLKISFLSLTNRILGSFFGVLKAGLLLSLAVLFLATLDIPSQETKESSFTYTTIERIAPTLYDGVMSIYPDALKFQESIGQIIEEHHIFKFRKD